MNILRDKIFMGFACALGIGWLGDPEMGVIVMLCVLCWVLASE